MSGILLLAVCFVLCRPNKPYVSKFVSQLVMHNTTSRYNIKREISGYKWYRLEAT